MKRNDMADMHKQMFLLVSLLKKDGHDPLAIAGCMLAGAVQIYQAELGMETTVSYTHLTLPTTTSV